MLWIVLQLILLWCVFISAAMAFAPGRMLNYVKQSRVWMWSVRNMFSITNESISSKNDSSGSISACHEGPQSTQSCR